MTQAMLRERLQMVTLNIIQFKISIYCYIYIGKRNIYIYVKSQSCGNLCHNLTDFKIWSIFKDRMDIYGRSLVVPARDSSTLQGAHQAVSIQRQKKVCKSAPQGLFPPSPWGCQLVAVGSQTRWTTTAWQPRPDALLGCFQVQSPSLAPPAHIIWPCSPPDGALGISSSTRLIAPFPSTEKLQCRWGVGEISPRATDFCAFLECQSDHVASSWEYHGPKTRNMLLKHREVMVGYGC